jgi:hypothetical protein
MATKTKTTRTVSATVAKPSQTERVLAELRKGRTLTQAQARTRGIMSLSSRVNELRQKGVPIASVPYRNKAGRTVVQYRMEA